MTMLCPMMTILCPIMTILCPIITMLCPMTPLYPDRNSCPKAGPKPCGWCGGHRGISNMSHCEPLFEHVTHFHLVGYVIFNSLS
jgi:hypothetical protein